MAIPAPAKPFYTMTEMERVQLDWQMFQAWCRDINDEDKRRRHMYALHRLENPHQFEEHCGAHARFEPIEILGDVFFYLDPLGTD